VAEVKKQVAGACPDLETIAAYLDGRLSERERARVTGHLAACDDCYTLFRESAVTQVAETGGVVSMRTWRERLPRPRVLYSCAAAALATAAAVWLVVGGTLVRPRTDRELQALAAALGTERIVEARLTGGFVYGPLRAPMRSANARAVSSPPEVRIAVARIEKEAAARQTPDTIHALGLAYLVQGDVNRAVAALEDAAAQSTPDARTLSDLSAAYLARASRANSTDDLMKGLTMAERAIRLDNTLAEALFNRAAILERLALGAQARDAWNEYLRLDPDSPWSAEAHTRAAALDTALTRPNR
jgi:tetratricopeptide (TPR) repeat protein